MILDGHIHCKSTETTKDYLCSAMKKAKVDGGCIISANPDNMNPNARPYVERLAHVLELCKDEPLWFPFLFIDPTAEDVLEQIDEAVRKGIAGFKIICNKFYPSDPRCVEAYYHIAKYGKPLLFHSGILWDGRNASGNYNRPCEFEVLLQIEGLRFALAHISWPWCDECLAVYGKFDQAMRTQKGSEMFIDTTPGTPDIYRKDALTKLIKIGYNVRGNIHFGLDNCAEDYNVDWAKKWIAQDKEILSELGLTAAELEDYFANNLLRFVKGG